MTQKIPFIGRIELGYRLLLVLAILVYSIAAIVSVNFLQVTHRDLIGISWCVKVIINNDNELHPKILSPIPNFNSGHDYFPEYMYFEESGEVLFPGFNSASIKGKWEIVSDKVIQISHIEQFKNIYEGVYTLKSRWDGTLLLTSKNTRIHLSR